MNKKSDIVGPELGARIRARRKSIGMTQADLASAIGVSFQQVQKYEKGISAISRSRLDQICEIMQLPPNFFLTAESSPAAVEIAPADSPLDLDTFLASGEGRRLVQAFASIRDEKLRTHILDFISAVASRHAR